MMIRITLFLLLACTFVACGADASPTDQPTPEPSSTIEDLTTGDAEATSEADSNSPGAVLFNEFYEEAQFACATCHYLDTDNRLLGPGLLSIEDRYDTYDTDTESLEDYIRQAIIDPRAFHVPDDSPYPENIMPINYDEIFTEGEIDLLIEYILSF